MSKRGVLLINLGTPSSPTPADVKKYLAEFLSDQHVVDFKPRWLWWLILHGIILNVRPKKSAQNYQKIWLEQGSPLFVYSNRLREKLAEKTQLPTALGMCYGEPSIDNAIESLCRQGVDEILAIPMYPQYSNTTTQAALDLIYANQQYGNKQFKLSIIKDYHQHPSYISALQKRTQHHWDTFGRPDKLLMSFHGIPQRYADRGDPYPIQCQTTAKLLASALQLKENEWDCVFQSRFGREPWLQPYCDKTLEELAQNGCKHVSVICPGFSVDCLETLEEMAITNKALFLENGGEQLNYIPALNDSDEHTKLFVDLINE